MSNCAWCKIAVGIVLLIVLLLLAQAAVALGAASGIVAALADAGLKVSLALVTNIIQVIAIVLAAGITISEVGDYIACKLFSCSSCCEQGSAAFWLKFGEKIQASGSKLSAADCTELRKTIRELEVNKQIDDETAQKLRDALAKHCPGS